MLGALLAVALAAGADRPVDGSPRRIVFGGDAQLAPFEFLDERGVAQGFNVELMRLLASRAGAQLEVRLGVWSEALADLEAGRVDVVAVGRTDARAARIDFLETGWTLQDIVLFAPGRPRPPASLAALAGETVAVRRGSAMHEVLASLPESSRPYLRPVPTERDALRLLARREATGAAGHALALRYAAVALDVDGFVEGPGKAFSYELATRKGRGAELAWIGAALLELRRGGERNALVERWLVPPTRPARLRDLARPVLVAAGALLVALLGVLAWNASLRVRVRDRTRALTALGVDLGRQNALLEALLEALPDLVLRLDADGRFLDVHGPPEELAMPPDQFLGRQMAELPFPPGLAERVAAAALSARQTGRPQTLEYELAIAARVHHYEARVAALRDGRETVIVTRNVTDRTRALQEVQASEERYRALFASLPVAVWVYDLEELRVLDVNPAAEAQYRCPRTAFVGRPLSDFLLPEGLAVLRDAVAHGLPTVVHGGVWTHRRADGSSFDVEVTSHAVRVGDRPARCEVVADVSERERSRRFKEQLLSVVAHELRSPLTALHGTVSLLAAAQEVSSAHREMLKIAQRSSERMDRLISDLLDLEKAESGGFVYRLEPRDVRPLLEEAVAVNQPLALGLGVALRLVPPAGGEQICVDADRLQQVLTNLIVNAVRHSPPDAVVTVSAGAAASGAVAIRVQDQGPGIPEEFRSRVFQRFATAASGARGPRGTGLGLAIARALVEGMGGAIAFESAPGQGTTFSVSFPAVVRESITSA